MYVNKLPSSASAEEKNRAIFHSLNSNSTFTIKLRYRWFARRELESRFADLQIRIRKQQPAKKSNNNSAELDQAKSLLFVMGHPPRGDWWIGPIFCMTFALGWRCSVNKLIIHKIIYLEQHPSGGHRQLLDSFCKGRYSILDLGIIFIFMNVLLERIL